MNQDYTYKLYYDIVVQYYIVMRSWRVAGRVFVLCLASGTADGFTSL